MQAEPAVMYKHDACLIESSRDRDEKWIPRPDKGKLEMRKSQEDTDITVHF